MAPDKLTDSEKKQYWRSIEERRIRDSEITTALLEGETKALERIVVDGKLTGFSVEQIQLLTKLTSEQMDEILKRHGLL